MERKRILCAKALIERLEESTTIIVFCKRIVQAEEFYRVLNEAGINRCAVYHSGLASEAGLRQFPELSIRALSLKKNKIKRH